MLFRSTCASDERIKKDVQAFDLGLNTLLGINPVNFKYNGLGGLPEDGVTQLGVIAQDIEKRAPQLVKRQMVKLHENDSQETEIKVVDYGAFTYVMINSIKELYAKWFADHKVLEQQARQIATVKEENEKLKAQAAQEKLAKDKEIADLKARMERLEKLLQK